MARNVSRYGLKVDFLMNEASFGKALSHVVHTCYDTVEAKAVFMELLDNQDKTSTWSLLTDHEWKDQIRNKMQVVK